MRRYAVPRRLWVGLHLLNIKAFAIGLLPTLTRRKAEPAVGDEQRNHVAAPEVPDLEKRRLEIEGLEKQARLLDLQLAHSEGERRLNDRHLRGQIASIRIAATADRVRTAFQIGGLVLGVLGLVLLGSMLSGAVTAQGLAVEPLRAPPDMAKSGLDGAALADRLLDRIRELQAETHSARAESSYSARWGENLKIDIPSTGISFGDLMRALRERYGHEVKITGDVYRLEGRLIVATRAGATPAKRFAGSDGQVEELLKRAAEDVYAQVQPYRYAVWLTDQKRTREAEALLQHLAEQGDRADRLWAYIGWASILQDEGRFAEAIDKAEAALRIQPDFVLAWDAVGNNASPMGHDERAVQALKHEQSLLARRTPAQLDPRAAALLRTISTGDLAEAAGDYLAAAASYAQARTLPDPFNLASGARVAEGEALAKAHQPARALARIRQDGKADDPSANAVRALALQEAGDWTGAAMIWRQLDADAVKAAAGRIDLSLRSQLATAVARAGDVSGAYTLIAVTPLDCYACLRARGQIAASARDGRRADGWFARALGAAPSLPFAETEWAEALLQRGDLAGAIAKARSAHAKARRFAEPLAIWAEAAARSGDRRSAGRALAEAKVLAPGWARLATIEKKMHG